MHLAARWRSARRSDRPEQDCERRRRSAHRAWALFFVRWKMRLSCRRSRNRRRPKGRRRQHSRLPHLCQPVTRFSDQRIGGIIAKLNSSNINYIISSIAIIAHERLERYTGFRRGHRKLARRRVSSVVSQPPGSSQGLLKMAKASHFCRSIVEDALATGLSRSSSAGRRLSCGSPCIIHPMSGCRSGLPSSPISSKATLPRRGPFNAAGSRGGGASQNRAVCG